MTPVTKRAIAALEQAVSAVTQAEIEDPTGMEVAGAEFLARYPGGTEVARTLIGASLAHIEKISAGKGQSAAYEEIGKKAARVSDGYRELGQDALADAFSRFAVKVLRHAQKLCTDNIASIHEMQADIERRKAEGQKGVN